MFAITNTLSFFDKTILFLFFLFLFLGFFYDFLVVLFFLLKEEDQNNDYSRKSDEPDHDAGDGATGEFFISFGFLLRISFFRRGKNAVIVDQFFLRVSKSIITVSRRLDSFFAVRIGYFPDVFDQGLYLLRLALIAQVDIDRFLRRNIGMIPYEYFLILGKFVKRFFCRIDLTFAFFVVFYPTELFH